MSKKFLKASQFPSKRTPFETILQKGAILNFRIKK